MNDPNSSHPDPAGPAGEAPGGGDAASDPSRPSVDLRTGDPSPSGTNPDGEVVEASAPDDVAAADRGEAVDAETSADRDEAVDAETSAGPDDAVDRETAVDPDGADGSDDGADPGVDLEQLADADPRSKAELIGALLDLEAARDEYLDDLRRARAEFENYRRRVTREAAGARKAGAAEAVGALLDVLDDLDRTLEAAEESSDESLAKGVQLVASKLSQGLRSLGVERIDEVGEPFDPTKHEAVQQLPADEATEEPSVAQILRPGYRLEDRVLRAAMVVVQG